MTQFLTFREEKLYLLTTEVFAYALQNLRQTHSQQISFHLPSIILRTLFLYQLLNSYLSDSVLTTQRDYVS